MFNGNFFLILSFFLLKEKYFSLEFEFILSVCKMRFKHPYTALLGLQANCAKLIFNLVFRCISVKGQSLTTD